MSDTKFENKFDGRKLTMEVMCEPAGLTRNSNEKLTGKAWVNDAQGHRYTVLITIVKERVRGVPMNFKTMDESKLTAEQQVQLAALLEKMK